MDVKNYDNLEKFDCLASMLHAPYLFGHLKSEFLQRHFLKCMCINVQPFDTTCVRQKYMYICRCIIVQVVQN